MTHRARIALLISVLVMLSLTVSAQDSYRVVEVAVEGNRIASNSLVLGVSSIEIGKALTPTDVGETIRRLYGLSIFNNVRVDAEPVSGGLKVTIVVDELPKLAGLDFDGNRRLKDEDIRKDLGLGVGGYISPYLIHEKTQEIKAAYSEKGYFQARVAPEVEYNEDSTEARLTFRIDERSKVKVDKVVITGTERLKPKWLYKKMRNRRRGFLLSSNFAKDEYEEDLRKVVDECHRRGFIDAYIISDSSHIDAARNRMTIYLEVYEGPQYYFGTYAFEGNEQIPDERLARTLKHKEGQVFNSEKYDRSLNELHSAYWEIGHLHAQVYDQRTTRNDSIVDITYQMSEGLPSHIRLVHILNNNKTKDKVIRREISMLPGMVYNQQLLIRSVRDVMALNYFENAVPNPVFLPSGDVDLEFDIKEKRVGEVMAGAGYNSTDKLVGNLSLGIPNFRGMGQNVSFSFEFGKQRNSLSVSFTEPWLFGRPTLMGLSLFATNRIWFEEYTEESQGGSIRIGRRLKWPDNYFRLYVSYLLERTRFRDFDDDFVEENSYKSLYYYDNEDGDSQLDGLIDEVTHGVYPGSVIAYNEEWLTASRLSFTLRRDSRNLPQFATKGSIMSYSLQLTGGLLGGYWNYQKHELELAKFIPIIGKLALAAKVDLGMITAPKGDTRILVSDRFTPGGTDYDGIVRGYSGGALTPDSLVTASDTVYLYHQTDPLIGFDPPDDTLFNAYTTRVRGKYMFVTNLELQFPIAEQSVYALAFYDAGNSWLHRSDIRIWSGLYTSVGLGFRVVVPGIGTIGFDFGYALDDYRGAGRGWKPHFQIGTTFR